MTFVSFPRILGLLHKNVFFGTEEVYRLCMFRNFSIYSYRESLWKKKDFDGGSLRILRKLPKLVKTL